jgi:hypothetical protein
VPRYPAKSARAAALLGVLATLASVANGCIQLGFERELEGSLDPLVLAVGLEEGRSTLVESLAALGSPEFMLKPEALDVERAYYSYREGGGFRLLVRVPLPIGDLSSFVDIFVLSFLRERLWLLRLDFDRNGVLVAKMRSQVDREDYSQYYGIDNNVVVTYLEEREQALAIEDEEEDFEEEDFGPQEKDGTPRRRESAGADDEDQ